MSNEPHYIIEKFDGSPKVFVETFERSLRQAAELSEHSHEIIAALYPAQEAAVILPEDFAPMQRPEEHGGNAAAGTIAIHDRRLAEYKEKQKAITRFRLHLVNHVTDRVIHHIEMTRAVRFTTLTLAQMLEALRACYGQPSASILRESKATLEVPFSMGMDLHKHIGNFNDAFHFHDRRLQPYSDHQKYYLLRQSIIACPEFRESIRSLERQFPTENEQTYARLCHEILIQYSELHQEAQAGQAAATLAASTSAPTKQTTSRSRKTGPLDKKKARRASATADSNEHVQFPDKYCWTHGYGFHHGKDCRSKAAGHQDSATKDETQGGSNLQAFPRSVRN